MSEESDDYYGSNTATFGDRLSAARENAGLTTKQLAKRIGIKHSTLLSWEDDLSDPRAPRLSLLAGMLNVSVGWLLTGKGEGLEDPDAQQDFVHADIAEILREVRAVQTDLRTQADKLAVLEKRLRKSIKSESA